MTNLAMFKSRGLALVVSAAVLALVAGGGGAVAGSLITSGDIQDKTIKKIDLHKNAVETQKVKDGTLRLADLNQKANDAIQKGVGPQGPKGEPGKDGKNGTNGVSGYEIRTWDYTGVSGGGWADMGCSAGKVPLGGGYQWKTEAVAMTGGLSTVVSMPGRMDWTTNTPDPTKPGWIIRPNQPAGVNPGDLTVYVICASMP